MALEVVASLSTRSPGFDVRLVNVGIVVDKEALGQFFHRAIRSSPVTSAPYSAMYSI